MLLLRRVELPAFRVAPLALAVKSIGGGPGLASVANTGAPAPALALAVVVAWAEWAVAAGAVVPPLP